MAKKLLMTASVWSHIRNFHLAYLQQLHQRGWETHIACANLPQDAEQNACIDKAFALSFEKKISSLSNFRAAWALRKLMQKEGYGLVISHTSLAAFFTRLALKFLPSRPHSVCFMHGYLFDDDSGFFKRQILLSAEKITAKETDLLLLMNETDYKIAENYRLGKKIRKIPGMGVDFSRLNSATKEEGLKLRAQLGIDKDDLPKVKEKFFKANSTVRGSGIGLAVSDDIMNMHKGFLKIDSEKGVGTTVTVFMPTPKANND